MPNANVNANANGNGNASFFGRHGLCLDHGGLYPFLYFCRDLGPCHGHSQREIYSSLAKGTRLHYSLNSAFAVAAFVFVVGVVVSVVAAVGVVAIAFLRSAVVA
jgi:hypothetical protein